MKFERLIGFREKRGRIARCIGMIFAGGFLAAACMAASGGCGTDLHKASVAADSIGSALNTAAQINHEDTLESAEDRAALAGYIDGVAKLNDTLVKQLQALEATNGAVTSAQLIAAFQSLNTQAQSLNSQGLLHLKSLSAQTQFTQVTTTIQGLLNTLQLLVPTLTSQGHAPLHRAPIVGFAAIALTAEDITALLALLVPLGEQAAALVEKLLAMKSETDAELQADALAQDAQAEQIAEADETPAPAETGTTGT